MRLCSRWLRHRSGPIYLRGSIHLLWRWKLLALGSQGHYYRRRIYPRSNQTKPSRDRYLSLNWQLHRGSRIKNSAPAKWRCGEFIGEYGEMEYTPHHQIIIRVETEDPANIIARLKTVKLLVFPIGDVAQMKACDFCNLEKDEAIPIAEEINR